MQLGEKAIDMYEISMIITALFLLPFIYVGWKLLTNNRKFHRIEQAIEKGQPVRLRLRNNYRDTGSRLMRLQKIAESRGHLMTFVASKHDKDYEGLATIFDVSVQPGGMTTGMRQEEQEEACTEDGSKRARTTQLDMSASE